MLYEPPPKPCLHLIFALLFLTLRPFTASHWAPCPSNHPEFAQIHVHWLSDALQLSCHLCFPSPPALNLSQHQVLSSYLSVGLRWPSIGTSGSASVFLWIVRVDSLHGGFVWSLCSSKDSQDSSPAPQFQSITGLMSVLVVPLSPPYMTTG